MKCIFLRSLLAGFCLSVLAAHAHAGWNSTIAASNPLNWYTLDETSGPTAFDHGSQGLNGTYGVGVNAPSRNVQGLVGIGVSFDGDQKNILLGGSDLSGDWSAEFIIAKTGLKTSSELLRGPHLASPSSHLKLEQYPNTHQVGYTQSFVADHVFSPAVTAPLNEFIDLVYVKTSSQMRLYVNGVLAGTNPSTISLARYQFGDTENESPIANVDEIVVWDRALSAEEISQHFNSIPEPSSFVLAALGLASLAAYGWRNRRLKMVDVSKVRRDDGPIWIHPALAGLCSSPDLSLPNFRSGVFHALLAISRIVTNDLAWRICDRDVTHVSNHRAGDPQLTRRSAPGTRSFSDG